MTMKNDIKKKISDLRQALKRHNELYYTRGEPEISDSKYDEMMRELKALEADHPEFFAPDSPTQTVGAPIPDKFVKIEHTSPMLSLDSIHDEKGAFRFDQSVKKELGDGPSYVCEPKLDGLSIELVYEKGFFARGATRGNGMVGEDVTLNLKTIPSVPQKLKTSSPPALLAVRGEVMMHIGDFNALNKKQAAEGRDTFANPRNVAAGSMRQLDYRITGQRKLNVYCYRILSISGGLPETQNEALELLKDMGFQVSPNTRFCENINDAIRYHHDLEEKRDSLDYEIDGVVLKVNSFSGQRRLGERTTNPRWAVAYKFKPRKEITRVEDIIVQVGRTGVLTPLALLQPVEVGGVTVARATLHNMDQVKRLGVKIGDHVKVERAGDVIPYVSEVVEAKRTGKEKPFNMPGKCPSCGTKLVREDVFYRCPAGLTCPAQLQESIIHYSSKGAVDIDGFSDKTVRLFYEQGLIRGISDIYKLKREDILSLEGWKEKKTDNLLRSIEKAKDIPLERFIYGLGIKNVGKHIATLLARRFNTLDGLAKASREELVEINEIGPEIAECIVDFFGAESNIAEIDKLRSAGVNIQEKKSVSEGKLAGKKIVFTGSLTTMSRSEAKDLVESLGGEAASSISSGVDFVVAGEKAGSKLDKARAKGIEILTEEQFQKMLK